MTNEFYPFEIDVSEFARRSKKIVTVHCQFAVAPTCPGVRTIQYDSARKSIENNDGKYKCRFCSTFLQRVSNDNKFDNITTNTDNEFFPFEIDVSELTYGSNKRVNVHCEFAVSPICSGIRTIQYRSVRKSMLKYDGKYKCSTCVNFLSRGRNHSSCKYKTVDDSLMKNIDSEEKAYFLGWIASDGYINKEYISIKIHKNDIKMIETLRDFICKELPLFYRTSGENCVGFKINSKEMVEDMCRHLKIKPGKKSRTVGFPDLDSDKLTLAFIRGLFDGDGTLTPLAGNNNQRACSIASISETMKKSIKIFFSKFDIYCYISPDKVNFCGVNSLNFLKGIYTNAKPHLVLARKFARYQLHLKWLPKKDQSKKVKATKPATKAATKPATKAATKSATKKPTSKPTTKPATKNRH
uniref:DOD-type homing endonuclease domain-containing protein n=1 Tax=viral metagenome TaxID=1070528 RepID=A0A6C0JS51_9ZZZZ